MLTGVAPVGAMQGYAREVAAYTRGQGRLLCQPGGYRPCAGAEEVIAAAGYDPLYGARPVKRTIQRYVVNDLSKRILAGDVNREQPIRIDADDKGLTFAN